MIFKRAIEFNLTLEHLLEEPDLPLANIGLDRQPGNGIISATS